MGVKLPDFSGWATKANIKCSDGRTIMPDAFKHMDGMSVPLVWQHAHNEPTNILGHAILHAHAEGVRADAYFNETPQGITAKALVQHKDVTNLSIYANKLVEKSKQVFHGMIRELSLVLSGANPGALIDNISLEHGDGSITELEDQAIIHFGFEIEVPEFEHASASDAGQTIQEIYDSFSDVQKNVVNYMIGVAIEGAPGSAQHSDTDENDDEGDLEHKEGTTEVAHNVWENNTKTKPDTDGKYELSHSDLQGILAHAQRQGSLKVAVEEYALAHGIDNIEILFPDAKAVSDIPDFISRRMEWVAGVLNGTKHSPFSRIKTLTADITMDDARAKGYIKGNMKKEEFFSVTKRSTAPTTVYKKQKLDRDDIVDITSFDVVVWVKGEMRIMLDEELARAILIGDGRDVDDEDKIKDPVGATDGVGIRSILNDHEFYVTTVNVNIADANSNYNEIVEEVMLNMRYYKGSGAPTFFTTLDTRTRMLLAKDLNGRRYYNTPQDLAVAMGVSSVVAVEAMETVPGLLGIIVNLSDYQIGTDAGGSVNTFDDFDIDYNKYTYLMETRLSGALIKAKSAMVIKSTAAANVLIVPTAPTFVRSTGVVTIPTQTGTVYKNADTNATLTAGAQTALAAGATLNVLAVAQTNYYYENSENDNWSFTRPLS